MPAFPSLCKFTPSQRTGEFASTLYSLETLCVLLKYTNNLFYIKANNCIKIPVTDSPAKNQVILLPFCGDICGDIFKKIQMCKNNYTQNELNTLKALSDVGFIEVILKTFQ